jgi:UbiD family decarboxylase
VNATVGQESLKDWIADLDGGGLLYRHEGEARVDELPQIMEDHPDQAVFVERVRDCDFPFLANAFASAEMCALALGCDRTKVGVEIGERTARHYPAEVVGTAPCKEVIARGDDVDLTMLPLFSHHLLDGQAFINCGRVVTRNPDTGAQNDGIQRLMFRTPNLLNIDMRALGHGGAINAHRYHDASQDTPVAVCVGGPTLDIIASMMRLPEHDIDAWDKLGGFLGGPALVVKCETSDLTVPANAEIVLEGRIMTCEGLDHDEGPYGEYTGTYGAGSEILAHNWNVEIDCITYRRDAIYQHATIAGLHPGRTDMYIWSAAIEGELYMELKHAGIHVLDVHIPPASCSNTGYARIKQVSGGDSKQTLATMLAANRSYMPKLAYVFDQDVDIFDDERVKWAQVWRYNPGTGTMVIPGQNVIPLDPGLTQDHPPYSITKIGFDCTLPLDRDPSVSLPASVSPPIVQPASAEPLDEAALVEQMTAFLEEKPRTWYEILQHFAGQPYPLVYRAFGRLRPRLGRRVDLVPAFPYTFADDEFTQGDGGPRS